LMVEALDSPIYTYMEYLSFKAFGVNIKALVIPSILYSLLLIVVTYRLVKRLFDERPALLVSIFLGFNFMFIQYNRLALLENLISLFLILSLYFCSIKEKQAKLSVFLGGIAFGCAVITKGSALFFLPGFLIALALGCLEEQWWKRNIVYVVSFIAGFVGVVLVNKMYLLILVRSGLVSSQIVSTHDLGQVLKVFLIKASVGEWVENVTQILVSRFSMSMPILFFVGFVSSLWFISSVKRPLDRQKRAELLLVCWIFGGILSMSILNYIPNRYRIPVIPPLCILGGISLWKAFLARKDGITFSWNVRILIVVVIGLFLLLFRFGRIALIWQNFKVDSDLLALTAMVLSILLVLYGRKALPTHWAIQSDFRKALLPCFLVLYLGVQFFQFIGWISTQKYHIKEGNRLISEKIEGGVLGGMYAPILAFESKNIAIPLWHRNLTRLPDLQLTHYVDSVKGFPNSDFTRLKELYPNFLNNSKWIADITLGNTVVSVYELLP
jgi:4-amino-4-deoxy-L-arabinose transferase-like glycosyltransferase